MMMIVFSIVRGITTSLSLLSKAVTKRLQGFLCSYSQSKLDEAFPGHRYSDGRKKQLNNLYAIIFTFVPSCQK